MPRRMQAGFTLLEVVLAMSALALMSVICYGAFHVGMRAVAGGTRAVTIAQRLRVASDVFTRQIRSVEPFPTMVGGFPEIFFEGTPTAMTFVTAAAQLGGGGLAQVTYRIEDDPAEAGKQRLILEEVPFFSAYTVGEPGSGDLFARTAVLLSGVEGVTFQYFDDDTADEPGCDSVGWCRSWVTDPVADDPRENVPKAVRVMIEHVPGVDTGVWGQETPLAIASYYNDENREVNAGLTLENDELDEEEEGNVGGEEEDED
jgi:prepilin-type N-terminal cleavage/methylation domain-containing protein